MKTNGFTPGPWKVKTVQWDNGERDAFIIQEMEDEFDNALNDEAMEAANTRFEANRVLTEAAPDLLAALEDTLENLEDFLANDGEFEWTPASGRSICRDIEKAIAAARGPA